MKAFGPELFIKMRGCVKILEEEDISRDDLNGPMPRKIRRPKIQCLQHALCISEFTENGCPRVRKSQKRREGWSLRTACESAGSS